MHKHCCLRVYAHYPLFFFQSDVYNAHLTVDEERNSIEFVVDVVVGLPLNGREDERKAAEGQLLHLVGVVNRA